MVLCQLFYKLAYPLILWSCVVFFFCDDHHYSESRWRCRFRGTFEGWEVHS